MPLVKIQKVVASLPNQLEADTVYFVRTGAGFDLFVTNSIGQVTAYGLNQTGGGGVFQQIQIDFGAGGSEPDSITVTVPDAGVTNSSKIIAQVVSPANDREFDEMEFCDFRCAVGNIQNGVGFDLIVSERNGAAHGQFLVNYSR